MHSNAGFANHQAGDGLSCVIVQVDTTPELAESLTDQLWELGALGVEERDATTLVRPENSASGLSLVAYFSDEGEALLACESLRDQCEARIAHIHADTWKEKWKQYYKPFIVGHRLAVRPTWETFSAPTGCTELVIEPGMAFGTGTHETTRLVLKEVERRITGGERILDVGCGSGILSIAALLLGAEHATAIDIDPIAVRATEENAECNALSNRLTVRQGTVETVDGEFDMVLANVECRVLIPIADTLMSRVAKAGTLVLSGILASERDSIVTAYKRFGWHLLTSDGEWIACTIRKK